jgi:hypothetical protein
MPLEWSRYNSFNLSDDHFDVLGPSLRQIVARVGNLESPIWKSRWAIPAALRTLPASTITDYEPGSPSNSPIKWRWSAPGRLLGFRPCHVRDRAGLGVPCRRLRLSIMGEPTVPRQCHHAWVEAYLPSMGWIG